VSSMRVRTQFLASQESEWASVHDAAAWVTVLDGLQAAAQFSAQPLFDAILSWRREMLARVNKLTAESSVPTALVVRKRVLLPKCLWSARFGAAVATPCFPGQHI